MERTMLSQNQITDATEIGQRRAAILGVTVHVYLCPQGCAHAFTASEVERHQPARANSMRYVTAVHPAPGKPA
jgi:hypothetical protein